MEVHNSPPPSKKRQKCSQKAFIAIHLGAGDHSIKKIDAYKSLCKKTCKEGMKILKDGGTADEAATIATVILEDSGLVNAGKGSSLSIEKCVEGDAGFMNGEGYFGGVAAVPGVQNPILIARKIADAHRDEPLLSCGRTPPIFLSGTGAKKWAKCNGIPTFEDNHIASKKAEETYERYMKRLQNVSLDLSTEISDTVGVVVMDCEGRVAATVSSGGNWLKQPGRVGHAPVFGCGCWASNLSENRPAIAVSSSGSGEILSKVHLPQEIAKRLEKGNDSIGFVDIVSSVIKHEFVENRILNCHKEKKNVGLAALMWDGFNGEFVWGHTSKNFIVAHLSSSTKSVKMELSELPNSASVQVNGIIF